MSSVSQTSGQTILQHGESVWEYLSDLLDYLKTGKSIHVWRIPEWLELHKDKFLGNIYDLETIKTYAIYHDCGKPFCRTVDAEGKVHFPNHAQVSYETWLSVSNDQTVANLVLNDMRAHTMKAEDVEDFCKDPKMACTLLLSALAEVHSNANMFGGIDSTSFKIKWKHLDKRGKKAVDILGFCDKKT
jgi:hypothetical protein